MSVEEQVIKRCSLVGGPEFRDQVETVKKYIDFVEPEIDEKSEESDEQEESSEEEEFKVLEVAEKLKLQLKKLELIRLLSDQMLKRKRLGRDIYMRGIRGNIRSIYSNEYKVTLYELLKAYSSVIMTKDFHRMNIPKLPVYTAEDGIKRIREFFGNLVDWKKIDDLIPKNFKKGIQNKKTGKAGIFAGSLELVKEGNIKIKQKALFDDIYIKEIK
mgnify:CR=1 FL=1